jgi:hypothetical protein
MIVLRTFASEGATPYLLHLAEYSPHPTTRERAAQLMGFLAKYAGCVRTIAACPGVMQALARKLKTTTRSRMITLTIIAILAWDAAALPTQSAGQVTWRTDLPRLRLDAFGPVIPGVVGLLLEPHGALPVEALHNVVATVECLAADPVMCTQLAEAGAIPRLVELLGPKYPRRTRESAMKALMEVVKLDRFHDAMVSADVVLAVVGQLEPGNYTGMIGGAVMVMCRLVYCGRVVMAARMIAAGAIPRLTGMCFEPGVAGTEFVEKISDLLRVLRRCAAL